MKKLARLSYNSANWHHPTGDAKEKEANGTFNQKFGFGYEDWLFRWEWHIDGWKYGFLQPLNKAAKSFKGEVLDITLFTIEPDKQRRIVGTIYEAEILKEKEICNKALEVFKDRGWYETMISEIEEVGGSLKPLHDPSWAENILNFRFKRENFVEFTQPHYVSEPWLKRYNRYILYDFPIDGISSLGSHFRKRLKSQDLNFEKTIFRKASKPVEYSPEHLKMQKVLFESLSRKYGKRNVSLEEDWVDIKVETDTCIILFEIKSSLNPKTVIREAFGQIMEYAYHPERIYNKKVQLVIVGRSPLGLHESRYIAFLRDQFRIPLYYQDISI